jgi:hypothetical protein
MAADTAGDGPQRISDEGAMTEAQILARFPNASPAFIRANVDAPSPPANAPMEPQPAGKPRLRQKQGDGMNKTERAFYEEYKSIYGDDFHAHAVTLVLANGVRFTVDFVAMLPSGWIAFETKGFLREDAAVKLKCAATKYPRIRFHLVTKRRKKDGGGWDIQEILP